MPLSDRDYMRGTHPAHCTCADCVERRRRIFMQRNRRRSARSDWSDWSARFSLPTTGFFASKYAWALAVIVVAVILAMIFL